jgi:hypothetical protein
MEIALSLPEGVTMDNISLLPELVEIAQQLKETNRLLAIIAGVPYQRPATSTNAGLLNATFEPATKTIRSVALDGTVNEAIVP